MIVRLRRRGDFWLWLAGLITFHVPRLMCVDGVRPQQVKVDALDATVVKKREASRSAPNTRSLPDSIHDPGIAQNGLVLGVCAGADVSQPNMRKAQ